jgi:hypothetical protein
MHHRYTYDIHTIYILYTFCVCITDIRMIYIRYTYCIHTAYVRMCGSVCVSVPQGMDAMCILCQSLLMICNIHTHMHACTHTDTHTHTNTHAHMHTYTQGNYFTLASGNTSLGSRDPSAAATSQTSSRPLFSRLIYPLPPTSGGGLGIHLTLDMVRSGTCLRREPCRR